MSILIGVRWYSHQHWHWIEVILALLLVHVVVSSLVEHSGGVAVGMSISIAITMGIPLRW